MTNIIDTKFGRASINQRGYYDIVSQKEGNFRKKLHRLIYEDYNGVTLMPWVDIHHKNGNKLDNSIENLEMIPHDLHTQLHHTGKTFSHTLESNMRHSATISTTNYFRVSKHKDNNMKQGFGWRYQYYDENGTRRSIQRVDLKKLEKEVKKLGLPWAELGDDA